MKKCSKCGDEKSVDEFHNDRSRTDGKFPYCKPCAMAVQKRTRNRSPEAMERRAREARLRYSLDLNRYDKALLKRYGATLDTYAEMLEAQKGVCAICGKPPTDRRLHLDHDHQTGKLRGLLCMLCNQGLGRFRDDAALLTSAIRYLQEAA